MKKTFYHVGLALFGTGMLASCANDLNGEPGNTTVDNQTTEVNLVHTPDAYAWSGSEYFGETRGLTRADDEDLKACGCPEDCEECTDDCDELEPGDAGFWCECQKIRHDNEVEVNFAINDVHKNGNEQKYDNADLWTKLSIHVRKATDVTIKIPMPAKYVVESDDFAIFDRHVGNYGNTGEVAPTIRDSETTFDYTIEGVKVTLTVNYEVGEDENDGQITISTSGITKELINTLYEKYHDGVNFEIWNYYQTETVDWIDGQKDATVSGTLKQEDYDAFKGILDGSTISFTTAPDYYINAFGQNLEERTDEDGNVVKNDNGNIQFDNLGTLNANHCLVRLAATETAFTMHENFCYHLNGTSWNIVYVNNSVEKFVKDDDGKVVKDEDGNDVYDEGYAAHVNDGGEDAITVKSKFPKI